MPRLFFAVHEQQHSIVQQQQHSIVQQQVKKPTPPTKLLVEWVFLAVQQRLFSPFNERSFMNMFFFGPPWTKSFAKSLFLLVHEQLYGIVRQHAFIPRWWTPPISLADYLVDLRIVVAGGMWMSSSATTASKWRVIVLFGDRGCFFHSNGIDRISVFLLFQSWGAWNRV